MVIITISGTPGSGKSTVSEILAKKIGIKYVYAGMIFRKMAEEHNMSLSEFGKYCEKNSEIDKKLDEKQVEILKEGNVLLEGRLAGWLAYKDNIEALKVMLDTDIEIRAERIVKREKGDVELKKSEMIRREQCEAKRYEKYYNIDIKDKSIYDLIIDTKNKTPEGIVEIILEKL